MSKRGKNLVLATISLNRSTRTPLYLQLYRELREAIETGRSIPRLDYLHPDRLPRIWGFHVRQLSMRSSS
ncbi:MAG: hypothetical protein H0V18_08060 [Pyrinomonadaceae bacterium]|nr:hypothetical protein [Pyrinomonadaceae bacterium]